MKPAEHIRIIKNELHKLNHEGHVLEPEQFVADSDLHLALHKLGQAYIDVDTEIAKLGIAFKWHSGDRLDITPKIDGEISVGEVIDNEKDGSENHD